MADLPSIQTEQGSTVYLWNPQVLTHVDEQLFEPRRCSLENALGRGTVYVFRHDELTLVVRHYRRGGLIRHFSDDLYLGTKVDETRMWREFNLLLHMHSLGLPVPLPVAVRCEWVGRFFYRGDLLTCLIPASRTLAQALEQHPLDDALWRQLGVTIARFHQQGVYHADLNANNILLNAHNHFFLLDFDRGRIRQPATGWQQNNLDRLLRSLHKMQTLCSPFHFNPHGWDSMLEAYRHTLGAPA